MKKIALFFLLSLLGISINNAQVNKIGFDIDYSQFSFDSDSNLVEFYYVFDTSSMIKVKEDSLLYVDGLLTISVEDTMNHKLIINRQWQFKNPIDESNESSRNLVGVLGFVLPEGIYRCKFTGANFYDSADAVIYNEMIEVNPLINDKINISGLELACKILPDSPNKTSMFYKNTYEVIPSPNVLFGDNQPALFYYFEMYNLNRASENVPLILKTQVFNTKGKIFYERKKYVAHNQDSRVEAGNINVNKFPTDSYTFVVSVTDSVENYGISSSKKFYIYNAAIPNTDTSYTTSDIKSLTSQFFALSVEELDNLFDKSKYIALESEINQYESLTTLQAKRDFLSNFWQKRDTDPSTPKNEYYVDYFKELNMLINNSAE